MRCGVLVGTRMRHQAVGDRYQRRKDYSLLINADTDVMGSQTASRSRRQAQLLPLSYHTGARVLLYVFNASDLLFRLYSAALQYLKSKTHCYNLERGFQICNSNTQESLKMYF